MNISAIRKCLSTEARKYSLRASTARRVAQQSDTVLTHRLSEAQELEDRAKLLTSASRILQKINEAPVDLRTLVRDMLSHMPAPRATYQGWQCQICRGTGVVIKTIKHQETCIVTRARHLGFYI